MGGGKGYGHGLGKSGHGTLFYYYTSHYPHDLAATTIILVIVLHNKLCCTLIECYSICCPWLSTSLVYYKLQLHFIVATNSMYSVEMRNDSVVICHQLLYRDLIYNAE